MSNETELIDEIASTLRSRYPDIGLNSYYDIKAAKDIVAIVKAQLRDNRSRSGGSDE